jgi:Putative beta barrel porin-7 (BBP7)
MKALIKGGLCVALSWLASGASAQELPVKWQAAGAKNSTSTSVVSPATTKTDSNVRPVTLSVPTPLDGVAPPPSSGGFAPIIRAQAPVDKNVPPVPILDVVEEPKRLEVEKGKDKDKNFTPPPPQVTPSPVYGNLGINAENCLTDSCCPAWCGPAWRGPSCCDSNCGDRPRFWMGAEYLMWWQRGQSVPPLVISSPPGTQPLLGLPTTTVLYDAVPSPTQSGARFNLGMWMPHFCCNLGVEVSYFFLGRTSNTSAYSSNGDPILARPFNDTTPGNQGPNAEIVAITGVNGTATIHTFSELWGIEGNLRYKWCRGPCYWLDIVGGYRYLNLSEGIDITEDRTFTRAGVRSVEQESFHTRNQFNGAQIGLDGEVRFCQRMFFGMNAKIAAGNVYQIIDVNGSTTFTNVPVPPGNSTQTGALLATPTNIGRYTSSRFGVAPELGLKIGIDLTDHLRLFVGYDFLYISNVVRPGDQIDTNVNQAFRPTIVGPGIGGGPLQPTVPFRTSNYWAQGLNLGLQYRF